MHETHDKTASDSSSGRKWWLIPAILLFLVVASAGAYLAAGSSGSTVRGAEDAKKSDVSSNEFPVEVVNPTQGVLVRSTAQAGTAMAFEWIDIYAEVPGYLKKRTVDIGSVVKKDDVLAEIEVPDLKARVEQRKSGLHLAEAQVEQKKAAIKMAEAEQKVSEARVVASKAKLNSDKAYEKYRKTQLDRYQALYATRSIDARAVDEQQDHHEAALEAVNASTEAVHSAEAQVISAKAKIVQTHADLQEAKSKVKVAQAELDLAQVMVDFAVIRAPFSGIISYRDQGFNSGAFIRAATASGSSAPLLTLQHTDVMRIVVPIPDRDSPYCEPRKSTALIVFDALPNLKLPPYPVSRIAKSEDLQTKTMRAEIDVPNPDGRIRQGMYGLVTVQLAKSAADALSIPSACLVGQESDGKATVFVIRDGKAHRQPIETKLDNGILVEVLKGLRKDDEVVLNPSGDLSEDMAVSTTKIVEKKASSSSE